MKYVGWIVSLVITLLLFFAYQTQYVPLRKDVIKLEKEITMWENVLKNEKGISSDRSRFAVDRFFEDDRLTPYAEVEILRKFSPQYKELELYIAAPHPLSRSHDVFRFIAQQKLEYKEIYFIVTCDSTERFEYKLSK